MFLDIRPAFAAFVRHVDGYFALIGAEAATVVRSLAQRLICIVVGVLCAWLSAALAVAWLVAGTWSTPYRLWVIGGLSVATGLIGAASLAVGIRRRTRVFQRLRTEWAADQAAFTGTSAGERDA